MINMTTNDDGLKKIRDMLYEFMLGKSLEIKTETNAIIQKVNKLRDKILIGELK